MEQTTTWMCPVCEKVLNVEDLIVDGYALFGSLMISDPHGANPRYFDDILKQTPDSVEDVIIEADGQWHTEDNKYASPAWKAAHPVAPPSKLPSVAQWAASPVKQVANGMNGVNIQDKPRPSNAEIIILDSDEEDEGRLIRQHSLST